MSATTANCEIPAHIEALPVQDRPLQWLKDRMSVCGLSQAEIARRCDYVPKHVSLVINGHDPISEEFGGKLLMIDELCPRQEDRELFHELLRDSWEDRKINGVDLRKSEHRPNPQRGLDENWLAGQPVRARAGLYLKALRERAKFEKIEGMTQPELSKYLGMGIGVREMEKGDVPIQQNYWPQLLEHPHLCKNDVERERFSQLLQASDEEWQRIRAMRSESSQVGVRLSLDEIKQKLPGMLTSPDIVHGEGYVAGDLKPFDPSRF